MPDRPFFDTNILIYCFADGDVRQGAAIELLSAGGVISVQSLNEFLNVVTRRMKRSWDEALAWSDAVEDLCEPVVPVTLETHRLAVGIARRYEYSIYDSLMLASALESSCNLFYSEDLQDGHSIHGLRIRNPFTGHDQKKKARQ